MFEIEDDRSYRHDQKKTSLVEFVLRHRDVFERFPLVATGSTGRLIGEKLGLNVECVAHGPDGGDLMIGARVAMGQIRAVIFFRDPLAASRTSPTWRTDAHLRRARRAAGHEHRHGRSDWDRGCGIMEKCRCAAAHRIPEQLVCRPVSLAGMRAP